LLQGTSSLADSVGENELVVDEVNVYVLGIVKLSVKYLLAELVFDLALNRTTQWTRTESRVETDFD
jgi:hypothetical protein